VRFWSFAAEVLGFLSAALLLWPAVIHNAQLRRAWTFRRRIARSPLSIAGYLREKSPLVNEPVPAWSPAHQWLLTAGALALLVSFLIKMLVLWATP
jgi:hypothetical protein